MIRKNDEWFINKLKVFHKGNPFFLVFTSFAVFAKLLNVQEHKGTAFG